MSIEPSSWIPAECDIAIIGGGFGGLMTLVHVLQRVSRRHIVLFERSPREGPGIAYGACDEQHLLNVPAGRMGATPQDPAGFLKWLELHFPSRFAADDFVPRALFGRYINELVRENILAADSHVTVLHQAVVHIESNSHGAELLLSSDQSLLANSVVLALGIPQAHAPWRSKDHGVPRHFLSPNPWDILALERLDHDAEVVLIGSGLTAVDVIFSLRRRGHTGKISVISSGGKFPIAHALSHDAPYVYDSVTLQRGPRAVFRAIRSAVKDLRRRNHSWHCAIDGIRPHAAAIWRGWNQQDRAYFLARLRPFWEIHRHRSPTQLAEFLAAEMTARTIEMISGTLALVRAIDENSVEVVANCQGNATRTLRASHVINCAGPAMSVAKTLDPLVGSMIREGIARIDALGLGLATDTTGRLIAADGTVQPNLFLLGALRRGDLWETTAVPELRAQASAVAEAVTNELTAV